MTLVQVMLSASELEGEFCVIKGIGLDLVDLDRIQKLVERQPKFVERILTSEEKKRYATLSDKRKVEFLSGRFAAKEAFAKAMGTGIGTHVSFQDIEVQNDASGKPYISKPIQNGVHLSITHSTLTAAAQVIIEE